MYIVGNSIFKPYIYYDMIAGTGGMGIVMLDDCNFHEFVRLDDFDLDRTLTLVTSIAILIIIISICFLHERMLSLLV